MLIIDQIRRIDDQSIIRYSNRFTLPLPDPFIEANKLQPKDEMVIYRDRVNGHDALIIIPKKSIENHDQSERTDHNREEKSSLVSDVKVV